MALINCPDCSKEISDIAPACPNCGRPNASNRLLITPKANPNPKGGANELDKPTARTVSLILAVGIIFVPYVFAWFVLLREGYSRRAKVITLGWLLGILFIFLHDGKSTIKKDASDPLISTASIKELAMQVRVDELLSAYESNEVAADNLYKGKRVKVTGRINDVKKDIVNNLYVTLGTGKQFEIPQLQAFFDDSMNQELSGLIKGQELTVVCTVEGLMMNVVGKKCVLE